jgi:hypothetical protein
MKQTERSKGICWVALFDTVSPRRGGDRIFASNILVILESCPHQVFNITAHDELTPSLLTVPLEPKQ